MEKKAHRGGRRHSREFRMEAGRLMEERGDDRSIQDVAEALGISPSLLYKSRELYGKDIASKKNELGESFAEENARLRRGNMVLRKEREILKKSVALLRAMFRKFKGRYGSPRWHAR